MDEKTALAPLDEKRYNAARQRITVFHERFGDGHLHLAYHAAFPMALTPDLLYRIRANFQLDNNKKPLGILWIAVADLLLSNLCEEVGYELYEMKADVRTVLLHELKNELKFGPKRIEELAHFLYDYVQQQMSNEAPALVQVQRWMALPYIDPTRAARELALTLQSKLKQNSRSETLRITSLIETFADPLRELLPEYAPLLTYAQDIASLTSDEVKSAATQPDAETRQVQAIKVFGVDLGIPGHMGQKPQAESKQAQTARKDFFISYHGANRDWAEWIGWQLEEAGYSTLLQVWNFQPDDNFSVEMDKALTAAKRVVIIFSQDYLDVLTAMSGWTTAFLQMPDGGLETLLPIRVKNCDLEALLGPISYLDLAELDELEAHRRLLAFLQDVNIQPVNLAAHSETRSSVFEKPQFPELAMPQPKEAVEIFICYAQEDEMLCKELENHLAPLKQQSLITIWHSSLSSSGMEWASEIHARLKTAQIILLLISENFLASNDSYGIEMKRALERYEAGEARVIPIILRAVDLEGTPVEKLHALPTNGRPVVEWRDRDEAFWDIATGIRTAIEDIALLKKKSTLYEATLQDKVEAENFDVFFSYNPVDELVVMSIAEQLKERGVLPWLEVWNVSLGKSRLRIIEEQIERVNSMAVFIGEKGIGSWQRMEVDAFVQEFLKRGAPIIPVLLENAPIEHQIPVSLRGMTQVDFRTKDPDPMKHLIWGITGAREDRETNQIMLQRKITTYDFDVFLCYNPKDQSAIKKIGEHLKERGILPWLDEWELRPGLPWQRMIEQQLERIKAVTVFFGKNGIGSWQQQELNIIQGESIRRGLHIIPVLLADAPSNPRVPTFLRGTTWVDFHKRYPDPLEQLIWGITGKGLDVFDKGDEAEVQVHSTSEVEETGVEKLFQEELFIKLAQEVVEFPERQRTALLIDLANRMHFDTRPTLLQQAFLDVGIRLQDYRKPLPNDPIERSRHAATLSIAYKRLGKLADIITESS